jgi:hypothetical protein
MSYKRSKGINKDHGCRLHQAYTNPRGFVGCTKPTLIRAVVIRFKIINRVGANASAGKLFSPRKLQLEVLAQLLFVGLLQLMGTQPFHATILTQNQVLRRNV